MVIFNSYVTNYQRVSSSFPTLWHQPLGVAICDWVGTNPATSDRRTLPTSRYGTGPRCAVWPLRSWGRIPSCNPSGAVRSSGRWFPELVERYSVSVMFLRAFIQGGWESIHPGNSMFHTSKWLAICQLIGALKPFYASILGCASHFAPGS